MSSTDTSDTVRKYHTGEPDIRHGILLSYHASENAAENTDEHVRVMVPQRIYNADTDCSTLYSGHHRLADKL